MRLTWRDAAATVLGGVALMLFLAVTGGWGWPLLGSTRMGVLALGMVGLAMCIAGGDPTVAGTAKSPASVVATALGGLAMALVIAGVISGSRSVLVALGLDMVALWLLTTTRHAFVRTVLPAAPDRARRDPAEGRRAAA
jgi:hypothetical protein